MRPYRESYTGKGLKEETVHYINFKSVPFSEHIVINCELIHNVISLCFVCVKMNDLLNIEYTTKSFSFFNPSGLWRIRSGFGLQSRVQGRDFWEPGLPFPTQDCADPLILS